MKMKNKNVKRNSFKLSKGNKIKSKNVRKTNLNFLEKRNPKSSDEDDSDVANDLLEVNNFDESIVKNGTADIDADMELDGELSNEEAVESDDDKEIGDDENSNEEDENSNDDDEINKHKQSLAKLKESDPEFYKFLQENDKKLLNFNVSDSEEDEDENEKFHVPDGNLEVASDESDFEVEKEEDEEESEQKDGRNKVITLKMIKIWQAELQTDKTNETIGNVIKAFHAALLNVSSPEDQEDNAHFKVKGSAVFNAVIQLCVLDLGPAMRKFLGIKPGSKMPPHKCKRFNKLKTLLKDYFTDLHKLLSGVTSTNIQTVLLKHLHYMSPMLASYPAITKGILKKLVHIWSTAAESVRVIAFLCILRISTSQQATSLDQVLKAMHLAYVKNSKFVSFNNLSVINFMKRSLVEMFALDVNVSYKYVFLYIRQLAIHLRNAIVLKKTENMQAVYNWQYINSLRLWASLFAVTSHKQQMKQLIFPFVQVCLGTLKLRPTSQYFPLRFHVCQILMELTKDTGVFVPVLPFILEALTIFNFNKKHTKVSMKPLHFTTILRLSKSELSENGFKDTCIDTVYGQILEYFSNNSSSIAFPDLSLFCVIQLKEFTKTCKVASYCKKMKQLVEKINQNAEFIQKERQKVTFTLADAKEIEAWERTIKNNGTPISTFYESWHKLVSMKKRKQQTDNDEIGDYNLPVLKKVKKTNGNSGNQESGPVTLFPSDTESEDEKHFGKSKKPINEQQKKVKKSKNKPTNIADDEIKVEKDVEDEIQDIVQDFSIKDW